MGKTPSRVWGFDARICGKELACLSEQRQRERWWRELLLRPEILVPRSVDPAVWPTVFDYSATEPVALGIDRSKGLVTVPRGTGCVGRFWLRQDEMKGRLAASGRRAECITVELFIPEDSDVTTVPSPLVYSEKEPSVVSKNAMLLGYDVANLGPLSGLTNCGYTYREFFELEPVWSKRINGYGLIQELPAAFEFLSITNNRAEDHGPFFVFGIHSDGEFIPETPGQVRV